jgi:acyl carrier protein
MARGPSLPATDPENVAQAIAAFVNANIMAPGRRIGSDDDFEAMGIDSMALLRVLLFVEIEFGFWPPDEDLVAENLRSADALARYICRRRSLP